jgi:hypothetical protein
MGDPLLPVSSIQPFAWNLSYSASVLDGYCFMQARIVALNASYFLKNGGHFVISIKVLVVWLLV